MAGVFLPSFNEIHNLPVYSVNLFSGSHLHLLSAGITGGLPHSSCIYTGTGNLSSGPHTCEVSTSPTIFLAYLHLKKKEAKVKHPCLLSQQLLHYGPYISMKGFPLVLCTLACKCSHRDQLLSVPGRPHPSTANMSWCLPVKGSGGRNGGWRRRSTNSSPLPVD